MAAMADVIASNINALKIPEPIKQGLSEFVSQVVDLYGKDLVSVSAFGSAVTGDYEPPESDINLPIVYSDLDIVELERVADLSRRWLRKHRFAPRFLSRRNIDESTDYFQIDFLSMRDAHIVICGQDVLAGLDMQPEQLRRQIAYEVKAMRMRLKQQYWRTVDEPERMRSVLAARFTSLIHLMRALLLLNGFPAPVKRQETIDASVEHFGIDRESAVGLLALRHGKTPDKEALNERFTRLMEMIRKIDGCV
jgi:predicted nucleotidyltransferase